MRSAPPPLPALTDSVGLAVVGLAVVELAVAGAAVVGLAVVGLAVAGAAVVGAAVVGVVGAAPANWMVVLVCAVAVTLLTSMLQVWPPLHVPSPTAPVNTVKLALKEPVAVEVVVPSFAVSQPEDDTVEHSTMNSGTLAG